MAEFLKTGAIKTVMVPSKYQYCLFTVQLYGSFRAGPDLITGELHPMNRNVKPNVFSYLG